MNNKGFTLIELLAVIIILLGIAGVSVVSITSSLKRNDQRECKREEELIINAAKVYFSLSEETNVTLNTLIDNKYLKDEDISKYDKNNTSITKNNGYTLIGECKK